ncbi:MAG: hypothetical protein KDF59_10180 [Nitrosomonas sp.]|nr:hypothetical protein [Nitrosomonas sp.]
MAKIKYDCQKCGKEADFETEKEKQLLLDDAAICPVTYIVECPHCGTQNSVTPVQ